MAKKGQTEVIPLRVLGFNGKFDSKIAPAGVLSAAENVQAIRRVDGGAAELRKRNGFSPFSGGSNIFGGGTVSSWNTGTSYNDELIGLDGLKLYSRSEVLAKWIAKGKLQRIAADLEVISGNEATLGDTSEFTAESEKPNVDIAHQDGYACIAVSYDGDAARNSRVYIRDQSTRQIVYSTSIADAFRMKVLAIASSFYLFSWHADDGKLQCRRIQTSAPTTISAPADVATDFAGPVDGATQYQGVYDVAIDVTSTRMWVAYKNDVGNLTIKSWTTSNTVGVSSTYTGITPLLSIGFLSQTFAGGSGYLGVGARVDGGSPAFIHSIHLITFRTSDGAETNDTTIETYSGSTDTQNDIPQITGYRSSGDVLNLFWSLYPRGSFTTISELNIEGRRIGIRGYSTAGDTPFDVALSVGLGSRCFKVGTKWYMVVAHHDGSPLPGNNGGVNNRSLMVEIEENSTGANGDVTWAGSLMSSDSGGVPSSPCVLQSVAALSATSVLTVLPGVLNRPPNTAVESTVHHSVNAVSLDFTGSGLGKPVMYNDLLHIPGANHKTYDGRDVGEAGFLVDPDGVALQGVAAGGGVGMLTPGKTYFYCVTAARFDAKGRLHRSAPSEPISITLTDDPDPDVAQNSVDVFVYNLRATDFDPKFNCPDAVKTRLEVWRTEGDGENFYLDRILDNDASEDAQDFSDEEMSDELLIENEQLYTDTEELANTKVPAVKVLHPFQTRLFALTGTGLVWHTKESAEGFGAEFTDEFRIALSFDEGGQPTTIGSVDTSLLIFKRKRAFVTSGSGPDDKGAGSLFPPPQPLEMDLGVINATGAIDVPGGIMCESATGRFLLNRALSFEPVEGTESYSVTIAGGVGVDARSMTAFVTNGAVLVRDWQLNQWFAWTKTANGLAGVAICRHRNQLVIFQSDGTCLREVVGQYFDGTSTAINEAAEFAYTRLENARIYQLRIVGEIMGTTTLTETVTYNGNASTAASKTRACSTADQDDLNVIPNTGRMAAIKVRIEETSTTEGFRLSQIGLEVAVKVGLKKSASSRNFS